MNAYKVLLATMLCATLAPVSQAATDTFEATVTHVVDGDTVWLRPVHGGKSIAARAQGIDAPESCQTGGRQSAHALKARLWKQTVRVQAHGHDAHGRLLVNLQKDGNDVWAEQVLRGHAWNQQFKGRPGPYATQEQEAREHKRGLWAASSTPTRPYEFRKAHGACQRAAASPRHKGSPHAPPVNQAASMRGLWA